MTRFRDFRLLLTLAAGAMAVSATAARAEYLQYKLYSAKVTPYSVNGTGLDDMPAPPPKIAAAPKTPRRALNGYANLTLNGTQLQGAPDGGMREQYDFPGEYAQRFDGVDKGGKKESITIHGRYDLAHRLHRGTAASSAPRRQ
jgi:hypothetical protein